MGRDLVRHAVALQHVLQRGDPESELLRQPQQLEDFVGPVAVGVHQALALQNLDQRLEFQVPRGRPAAPAGGFRLAVTRPRVPVLRGPRERLPDHVENAHPGRRVAARPRAERP